MTGLAIGFIKARDEISEVVVVIAFRTRLLDTFVLVYISIHVDIVKMLLHIFSLKAARFSDTECPVSLSQSMGPLSSYSQNLPSWDLRASFYNLKLVLTESAYTRYVVVICP